MADPDGEVTRLRALGLGVTRPRRLVLAALRGRSVPASAGEVYDALRAGDAHIALTSVYRVLHLFAQEGLVHVFVGDEQRYRLCSGGPHAHLVCQRCGAVRAEPADQARRWLTPASLRDFDSRPARQRVVESRARSRGQPARRPSGTVTWVAKRLERLDDE